MLVLNSVQAQDGGDYTVKVSNAVGSVLSNAATLTVVTPAPPTAPVIAQQPRSVWVNAGQSAVFAVNASGTGPLTYQWPKNGVAIAGAQSVIFEETSFSMTDHCALYAVTITNAVGSVTSQSVIARVSFLEALPVSDSPVCEQTLHSGQQPEIADASDGGTSYELAMKFTTNRSGVVTAIRHYKSPSEPAAGHVGKIWSASGTLLATVNFSSESVSGWQQASLSTPFPVQAGVVYVVSVNISTHYPGRVNGLASTLVRGNLSSVNDGASTLFGPPGVFPTLTYFNNNYFRDVVFVAD